MHLSDITLADVGRTLHIEGDSNSPYKINHVGGTAEVMFGPMYASIEEALGQRHTVYRPQTIQVNYYPDVGIKEIVVNMGIAEAI